MLSRIKWESIDDFRPPNGSLKHVPESELKTLAQARAQKDNNALVALVALRRTGSESLTIRQQDARKHELDLVKDHPILKAEALSVRSAKDQPISSSAFENVPFEIKRNIVQRITFSDLVCLGLTSTMMMRVALINQGRCIWPEGRGCRFLEHLEILRRLKNWMPTNSWICRHCLLYLPAVSFGPARGGIHKMICMDCKYRTSSDFQELDSEELVCDGCVALQAYRASLEDNYPCVPDHLKWDYMRGLNMVEINFATGQIKTG